MVSQGNLAHALSVFSGNAAAAVKSDQDVGPLVLYQFRVCCPVRRGSGLFLRLAGISYLVFAFFFSIGLHPVGARWIQEHYTYDFDQETFSYYGPINLVALNMGYHNEHHDLPSVPWNNLP